MTVQEVSSKVVFARVSRLIEGSDWRASGHMYLGDGIQYLGHSTKRKALVESRALTVANHKAEIPCDVEFIEKIIDQDTDCRLQLNREGSMLGLSCDDYTWSKSNIGTLYYMIVPPFIHTSFEEGTIELFYRAYDMDDDGFIKIPDTPQYRNALVWYILKNLLLEGYKLKDNSINHAYAEQMFDKYARGARSSVKSFSRDQREQFARMWNSTNTDYLHDYLIDVE